MGSSLPQGAGTTPEGAGTTPEGAGTTPGETATRPGGAATRPGRRTWLALLLVLCAAEATIAARAWLAGGRIHRVSELPGFVGLGPVGGSPPALLLPTFDAYQWIRLTHEAREQGEWRFRRCEFDAAPHGREVYWSLAFPWCLRAVAWVDEQVSSRTGRASLEQAAVWTPPLLLLLLLPPLVVAVARRWGVAPAAMLALWMTLEAQFQWAWTAGNADHHGLAAMAALLTILGVVMALSRAASGNVRGWLLLSAVAGAAGSWISVTSQVQIFIGVGLGILAAARADRADRAGQAARGGRATSPAFDHLRAWPLWGRVGAAASLLFYLLEQFPDRLGMRLEVNHPLHALAWLGAGELLGILGSRLAGGQGGSLPWARVSLALAAIVALPIALLIGGARWHALGDPLMQRVHESIAEFQPITSQVAGELVPSLAAWLLLLAALAALPWRDELLDRPALVAAAAAGLVPMLALLAQARWSLLASAALAVLVAVLAREMHGLRAAGRLPRIATVLAGMGMAGVLGVAALEIVDEVRAASAPASAINEDDLARLVERDAARLIARDAARLIARDAARLIARDAAGLIARDAAGLIARDAAGTQVTLLGGPDTMRTAYYGSFRVLGSLYWENAEGLRAADRILFARTSEALTLLQERGVTHLVAYGHHSYLSLRLRDLATESPGLAPADTLAGALLTGQLPPWLRPLPFPTPSLPPAYWKGARLCRVVPDQSPAEALHHAGVARWAEGDRAGAEQAWQEALERDPGLAASHVALGTSLAERGEAQGIPDLVGGLALLDEDREAASLAALARLTAAGRHDAARALVQALGEARLLTPAIEAEAARWPAIGPPDGD